MVLETGTRCAALHTRLVLHRGLRREQRRYRILPVRNYVDRKDDICVLRRRRGSPACRSRRNCTRSSVIRCACSWGLEYRQASELRARALLTAQVRDRDVCVDQHDAGFVDPIGLPTGALSKSSALSTTATATATVLDRPAFRSSFVYCTHVDVAVPKKIDLVSISFHMHRSPSASNNSTLSLVRLC
jgi:hypothetical protein